VSLDGFKLYRNNLYIEYFERVNSLATNTKQEMVDYRQLGQWTLIAAVVSAVVNSIVFFIAQAMGVFDDVVVTMGGNNMAFSVVPVIMLSIVFILISGGVMWLVARFSQRPISTWRIVAIVALILSFGLPFSPGAFENPTATLRGTLLLMHTLAGVITIYLLTTRTQKAA
jgi:hypothetical protein